MICSSTTSTPLMPTKRLKRSLESTCLLLVLTPYEDVATSRSNNSTIGLLLSSSSKLQQCSRAVWARSLRRENAGIAHGVCSLHLLFVAAPASARQITDTGSTLNTQEEKTTFAVDSVLATDSRTAANASEKMSGSKDNANKAETADKAANADKANTAEDADKALDADKAENADKAKNANSPSSRKTGEGETTLVDPIRWFGILVPPALRSAQASFVASVKGPIPQLSTLASELRGTEVDIGRLRKQIKKL
jgi:cytoskeletal protein RodZ